MLSALIVPPEWSPSASPGIHTMPSPRSGGGRNADIAGTKYWKNTKLND
jgi:hypothetical protein